MEGASGRLPGTGEVGAGKSVFYGKLSDVNEGIRC